jgi:HEAT repeat protein
MAEFAGSSDDGFDEENPSETALKIRTQLDEKATDPLIYALDDIEDLVRGWALDALINIGGERSVEHLVTLSKEGIRDAESALCDLKHPSMVVPMMKLYESEEALDRSRAVKMLGNYDNPELTDIFLSATTDSSPLVRVETVTAIANREDSRIDDALFLLIQDDDEWVRTKTIYAMSHRASQEAVDRLIVALDDTDNMVRETAAKALMYIPIPDAEKALLDRFSNDRLEIVSSACEFFIRKGIPESEQVFINAMKQYGWRCADSLAYSGNPLLETAARDYLREYYFPSVPYEHEDSPKWGSDRKDTVSTAHLFDRP